MVDHFPWLTTLIAFPAIAATLVPVIPDQNGKVLRWYALAVGLIEFSLMVWAFWQHYDFANPGLQMVEQYPWIPQLGLNWSVAVDGLSMPLIVLTGFVNTLAIFSAWTVTHKTRLFYGLMLLLYSAQIGVFAAQDMLLFFTLWELELVPVYLLISIWGGPNRAYAATKFILYTALGSIFILVMGLAMAFSGNAVSFDMATLAQKHYSLVFEVMGYIAFLIAFGVKLPIFPFHTWLPDAHGEASAPVSMILAGVLLKMGGYGLIRMNVEMFPNAHVYLAPALAVLGVVNIVYGALTAFSQSNLKRCLACSSISHMGFVLIGISALTEVGFSGAVLQMLSHGLIAAALFFLAGVTYERTHTLVIAKMGGIAKVMPKVFALFTAGTMASLALPGMSGFVSELTIFLGVASSPVYNAPFKVVITFLTAVGLILTPVYLLSMLRRVFYGTSSLPLQALAPAMDAQPREVFIAACLIVPIIAIGFYPKLATQTYDVTTVAIASQLQTSIAVAQAQGNKTVIARTNQSTTALLGSSHPRVSSTLVPVIPR